MNGWNPFNWYGPEFLSLYAALFVAAILASLAICFRLRPEGREMTISDEDELAVLTGGRDRLGETVVARLLARGEARIESAKIQLLSPNSARVEPALAGLSGTVGWGKLRGALGERAERIEHSLIGRGMLMEKGDATAVGFLASMPFLALIGIGLIKIQVGNERHRPVMFLTIFLIVTTMCFMIRWLGFDRRTRAGTAAIKEAQARSSRLKLATPADETGLAVALFGTAVLAGSPYARFHALRSSSGGADGGCGGDGGGGCGGGGCGGGGCGGCGG